MGENGTIIHAQFGRPIWTRTLPREGGALRFCAIPSRRLTTTEKQAIRIFCYTAFAAPNYRIDDESNLVAFRSLRGLNYFMQEFNKSS